MALQFVALAKDQDRQAQLEKTRLDTAAGTQPRVNPLDTRNGLRVLKYKAPHERNNRLSKGVADQENIHYTRRLPNQTFVRGSALKNARLRLSVSGLSTVSACRQVLRRSEGRMCLFHE